MKPTHRKHLKIVSAVLAGFLTLTAAPRIFAQSNMEPAAASTTSTPSQVVDQLLSMVEHEMVPLAEAMPADKYNFAPTNGNFQGVRTFAEQVRHIIHANYAFFGHAASMQFKMPAADQLKTKAQMVQALKDSFVFAHQAVATLDQNNALENIKPLDGVPSRAGIMVFAVVHMNDHFGQLVEYLRMNGIVPPSSQPMQK